MSKTKAKQKTAAAPVDWSLVPHGPVSRAAVGSLVLTAAGALGGVAEVAPWWAAAAGALGAIGSVFEAAHRDAGPGPLLYRMSCWAGGAGWMTWAWWTGDALTTGGVGSLVLGAVGAAALAPLGRIRKRPPRPAAAAPGAAVVVADPAKRQIALEWQARIRRVTRINVVVTDVRDWSNGAGYDVIAELPPGPHTRRQIEMAAEALATDARLPDGCGVEPRHPEGLHRGMVVLGVSTVDRLRTQILPHPDDYTPRSILDPLPIGEARDSSLVTVGLREDSMLVVGRRRGGKTNFLDVTTLGVARCNDALVWHIDMNGGGMSQLWLNAWLEGETDRPPLDWCAANAEEALLMTTVALAIAKDRKTSYRQLKVRSNAKLLPISPDLPEIVVFIDEAAEVLSPSNRDPLTKQVRDNLEELQRIAGNEAVNVVVSSLRPNQDMISPQILKQAAVKVALYGLDEPDLGHLYNWNRSISTADLPTKGCAFVGKDAEVTACKAWYLEPGQIGQAAVQIAATRPELDASSTAVANGEFAINFGDGDKVALSDIYANRYERMRTAFTGGQVDLVPRPATHAARPAPAGAPERPHLHVVTGSASSWADPMQVGRPAPTTTGSASSWPDPLDLTAYAARRSGPSFSYAAPTPAPATPRVHAPQPVPELDAVPDASPARPVPAILARALQAFEDANDDRMHSETLAAALGVDGPHRLAELLRPYGVTPRETKITRGGVKRRGYWVADIITAINAAPATAQAR